MASRAKASCALPSSKMSSGSARPPAISVASLKRARKSCTTSSLLRSGVEPAGRVLVKRVHSCCAVLCTAKSGHPVTLRADGRLMVAPLKAGLAGLGTVGSAVVRLIAQQRDLIAARCGRGIEVVAVSARTPDKRRDLGQAQPRFVSDPITLAADAGVDVFVELMGGEGDPA